MDDPDGIVWFVDGREMPFAQPAEARRPWLEESSSWGSRDDDSSDDDKDGEGPNELLWI